MKARSVGESSTTMIFRMVMRCSFCVALRARSCGAALREMQLDRLEQAFLREGLGEVFVGAHHAAACAVEQAVLRRKHDDGRRAMLAALLDERARLVAIEARHHDVDEDEV